MNYQNFKTFRSKSLFFSKFHCLNNFVDLYGFFGSSTIEVHDLKIMLVSLFRAKIKGPTSPANLTASLGMHSLFIYFSINVCYQTKFWTTVWYVSKTI